LLCAFCQLPRRSNNCCLNLPGWLCFRPFRTLRSCRVMSCQLIACIVVVKRAFAQSSMRNSHQSVSCCQPSRKGLWAARTRPISVSITPRLPQFQRRAVQSAVAATTHHSSAEAGMDVAELSVTAELLQRSESTDAQQAEAAAAGDAASLSKVGGGGDL
jgi:hypothetical protein